jgi:hypothetical protein
LASCLYVCNCITTDSGLHRRYARSGRLHNVKLLGGRNQNKQHYIPNGLCAGYARSTAFDDRSHITLVSMNIRPQSQWPHVGSLRSTLADSCLEISVSFFNALSFSCSVSHLARLRLSYLALDAARSTPRSYACDVCIECNPFPRTRNPVAAKGAGTLYSRTLVRLWTSSAPSLRLSSLRVKLKAVLDLVVVAFASSAFLFAAGREIMCRS